MSILLYCIAGFILIGGAGMYVGNRKVDAVTAKHRWIKFISYLVIVSIVFFSILLHLFKELALLIVVSGFYEMIRTVSPKRMGSYVALVLYLVIAMFFLFFAYSVNLEFCFFVYFQVLTFDAFCQVTGQLLGKTPLAKNISPTKTIEGLAGGCVFCLASSVLAADFAGMNFKQAIFFGVLTMAAALFGDLLASWYKRFSGIKDYSNFLPGQGGFLDRFDSLIMAGTLYAVLYLVNAPFLLPYFND